MIRIKLINDALRHLENGRGEDVVWDDCVFVNDAYCRDYDWLLVYDDFPHADIGTIHHETEPLACPRERTILVTAEPPSIKIYPHCFSNQFGWVLTTHARRFLRAKGWRLGHGCLQWMAGYPLQYVLSMPEYAKDRLISTVCSAKQQRHTQHCRRYSMVKYLSERMPELEWYGWGVRNIKAKYDALNAYRYHVAAENYINEYHWTDKISDPILALCLTFYAGDPKLGEVLPPESFIPIPIDDPERAHAIMREAIARNEYEKRLPAIREARRLIVQKYNLYAQVVDLIHEQSSQPQDSSPSSRVLRGRHTLRRNPWNALTEGLELLHYKTTALFSRVKH